MYQLTPRMLQRFRDDLRKYHDLFSGGRCAGWEQEELLVNAIKSDTKAQHHVMWQEAGHDDAADILIRTNGTTHALQVKSGQVMKRKGQLKLSGHRLGRFRSDLAAITAYLNSRTANIVSVPYRKVDGDGGREHHYSVWYIDAKHLAGLTRQNWKKNEQVNASGVRVSLRPSMSWQVWWEIPVGLIVKTPPFIID